MRFIATADWQLGMVAGFLEPSARSRYQQARLDAVQRVGEVARERGAAFVVVGGDVFESNQLDRAIVARTFEVLRTFPVPVVLLPGNHDPLDSASIYDSAAFTARPPGNVHVLRDSVPYEVVPGVEVVGAPWSSKRPLVDLVGQACRSLEPAPPGVLRVVLGHGAASTLQPDRENPATIDVPALSEVLLSGRAHVAVLGDRHSTTQVAPGIWYPGTPEVTRRREEEPGNVLVVDVAAGGGGDGAGGDGAGGDGAGAGLPARVTVERVRVGRWRFETVRWDVNSSDDVARLAHHLAEMPHKERTAVWLALTGTLTTRAKAELDELLDEARDLFALLEIWERNTNLAVMPDAFDFADLGLGGFAREAVQELTALAGSDKGAPGLGSTDGAADLGAAEVMAGGDPADTDEDGAGLDHEAIEPEPDPAEVAQGALSLLFRLVGSAG